MFSVNFKSFVILHVRPPIVGENTAQESPMTKLLKLNILLTLGLGEEDEQHICIICLHNFRWDSSDYSQ